MERFTEWMDDAKTEVSIVNYKMREAMLRLAAYEDTDLMPDQIYEICTEEGKIPKQPVVNKYFYFCPNCGSRRSIRQKHKFCHDCGQAFDW